MTIYAKPIKMVDFVLIPISVQDTLFENSYSCYTEENRIKKNNGYFKRPNLSKIDVHANKR